MGLQLTPEELTEFATVTEPAHDQAPATLVAVTLFLVRQVRSGGTGDHVASAEVAEVAWSGIADAAQ